MEILNEDWVETEWESMIEEIDFKTAKSDMRKSILSAVAGVTFLLSIAACSEENKYDSSVVTDIQLYLDDEGLFAEYRLVNKPCLFMLPMANVCG